MSLSVQKNKYVSVLGMKYYIYLILIPKLYNINSVGYLLCVMLLFILVISTIFETKKCVNINKYITIL